ncbi:MAG: tetratricopeptide repeat protein [Myxococcaceae bacterium]|nr:tetratricopeptide repeat protein [Myxococcaceae bacterium]
MKPKAKRKPARSAPKRRTRKTTPKPKAKLSAEVKRSEAARPARAFPLEIDPRRIEASLAKLKDELAHWANKGRYTRVRFKFRGRQLLPDLPLAAVLAAEGLTFYWAGILRPLLVTVGAGALLDVELVNDSEKKIAEGKEALLAGDADRALELFRKAAAMQRDNPRAHLNIGIVLKLRGDVAGARAALKRAKALDPDGTAGAEAERVLATLPKETVGVDQAPA